MKLLIKQVKVVDPLSAYHQQVTDIFIEDGIIQQIGSVESIDADETISENGLIVSPGWIDIFSHFNDPGIEQKETLETGADAAAKGGFTDVFLLPNTNPVVYTKSGVEYIRQRSHSLPVTLHPIGAVTKKAEGKELAEMYDMRSSGAIAFSDGTESIQSAGLLVKALQYIKPFDGVIIQLPDDRSVNPDGLMHEGIISTQLGLPGKPALAEELIIERDLRLTEYADSKIHFTGISTVNSLEQIRKAKEKGLAVTCSVTPYHLFFCDDDLKTYDTNLKVNPPLRTAKDRDALQTALKEGLIDIITSHHQPHENDVKMVEFEYAAKGMIGLETCYSIVHQAVPDLSTDRWIECISINPRKIFGLAENKIQQGEIASLTFFNPDKKWNYTIENNRSRSKNSPFLGQELSGTVTGIFHKGKWTSY